MTQQADFVLARTSVVDCIRRWGGAASDAALDPSCRIFAVPHIDGLISYREEAGCRIVYGDPICAPENVKALTQAFHHFSHEKSKNIIYVTATHGFIDVNIPEICLSSIEFGEELFIDPHDDPREKQGENASLVRRKVRHALKEGTTVKEYLKDQLSLKLDMEKLATAWLNNRRGPQIHTSNVFLFDNQQGKRWWYAQQQGRLVGVAVLNQLQAHQGWLLNHVMILPDAPGGTPELLVVDILNTLKAESCHYVTFGAVPAEELRSIQGLAKFPSWLARSTFQIACKIFKLDGRKKFWEKFNPDSSPSYLAISKPTIGFTEIKALMKALNVSL